MKKQVGEISPVKAGSQLQEGVLEWSQDAGVLSWSGALSELLGKAPGEIPSLTFRDWLREVQGENRRALLAFIRSLLQGKEGQIFRFSLGERPDRRNLEVWGKGELLIFREIPEEGGKEMEQRSQLLEGILDSLEEGILALDQQGRTTYANAAARSLLKKEGGIPQGADWHDLLPLITLPGGKPYPLMGVSLPALAEGMLPLQNIGLLLPGGKRIPISLRLRPLWGQGVCQGYLLTFREALEEDESGGISKVNLDMLFVMNEKGSVQKINVKVKEVLGYSLKNIRNKTLRQLVHIQDWPGVLDALNQTRQTGIQSSFTCRIRCRDGCFKHIEWYLEPGEEGQFYASARDVTRKISLEEELRRQAIRDELTGIYNRHHLEAMISREMDRADRFLKPFSILIFDLDHFKRVNDTYGHHKGDEILQTISRFAERNIRVTDTLFRMGGEEFLIMLPETGLEGALILGEKLRSGLEALVHPDLGHQTVSFGAGERMRGESFRYLFKRTDQALYRAKEQGRNRVEGSRQADPLPLSFLLLNMQKDWEWGNAEIDGDHQALFKRMNSLWEAHFRKKEGEGLGAQARELLDFMESHFQREEAVLEEEGYLDLEGHKAIHQKLRTRCRKFLELYMKGEIREAAFLSYLSDEGILDHLILEDRKYMAWMAHREGRVAP